MDDHFETTFRAQARADTITHLATGIAVIEDDKILMVRRVKNDTFGGYYELPGGGVDEGETIRAGALRELTEETGLQAREILATFEGFDYATRTKPRVRQVNYLVAVKEGTIVLDPREHDDYLWVDQNTLHTIPTTPSMTICVEKAFEAADSLS